MQYVNTGILPFQVENLVGIPVIINGALTPVTIATNTFGSFQVIINPPSANYPTVNFSISKSDPT